MKRTSLQNASLHLYYRKLSEALNDGGFEVTDGVVLKLPVMWTPGNVKSLLGRPIMTALYPDKTSTTELESDEVSEVYQVLDKAVSERTGVHVPFPSEEELIHESRK